MVPKVSIQRASAAPANAGAHCCVTLLRHIAAQAACGRGHVHLVLNLPGPRCTGNAAMSALLRKCQGQGVGRSCWTVELDAGKSRLPLAAHSSLCQCRQLTRWPRLLETGHRIESSQWCSTQAVGMRCRHGARNITGRPAQIRRGGRGARRGSGESEQSSSTLGAKCKHQCILLHSQL